MTARQIAVTCALSVLLASGGAFATAAAAATNPHLGDWPQPGYDATGSLFNSSETSVNNVRLPNAYAVWSLTGTPSGTITFSKPIIVGANTDVVTTRYGNRGITTTLDAYNTISGKHVFSKTIATKGCAMDPYYDSGRIIVRIQPTACFAGDYPTTLYAFNPTTGARLWKADGGLLESDMTASGGRIFSVTITSDIEVQARSGATGKLLWKAPSLLPTMNIWDFNTPLVVNGLVLQSTSKASDGTPQIVALSASTGKVVWILPNATIDGGAAASTSSHLLFATTTGATNGPIDTSTGQIVAWTNATTGDPGPIGKNAVFTMCAGLQLCALSLATGTVMWSVPVAADVTPTAVANGVLYGTLNASQPTQQAWSTVDGSSITVSSFMAQSGAVVAVGHGHVFTGTNLPNGDQQITAWAVPGAN